MKSGIAALWGALLVLVCASAQAGQQTAVDWLQNQIAVDGHFENQAGLATDFQAASAAFRALADQADPAELEAALAFLRTQGYDSTENLSRKIIAGRLQGESVSTLVAELAGRQNPDGGFGELVGYNSTILDTAWALKALDAAHEPDATVTGMAVQYILDHQQSDGGWLGTGGNGSLYVSAMATNAIWHLRHVYNLTDSINAAVQHLLAERNGTDLWSEPFVSAAALIAVAPALVDSTKISDSVSQLAGLQLSDGSWDDDVFTTALALRALQAVQRGDPDLGIIRGRIIDGDYGYPVAGVHIAATGPESLSATTDEQGNFELANVLPGSYAVSLTSSDYPPLNISTSLAPGATRDLGNIRILRAAAPSTARVTGTVTDASTGAPIVGAAIDVLDTNVATTTGDDGQYVLAGIPPGDAVVEAAKPGYQVSHTLVHLEAGQTFLFSPTLSAALSPAFSLSGTITDGITGDRLSGVSVVVAGDASVTATTDASGYYQLSDLTPGNITVRVAYTGYQDAQASFAAQSGTSFEFSPSLYPSGTTSPPESGGSIVGTIIDGSTKLPLPSVKVSIVNGQTATGVSAVDGSFELDDLAASKAQIEFTLNGYISKELYVPVAAGVASDIGNIAIYPIDAPQPATAIGLVVDSITNKPLADVAITATFRGNTHSYMSGPDGRFQIDAGAGIAGNLEFSAEGYLASDFPVFLESGVNDLGKVRLRQTDIDSALPDLAVKNIDQSGIRTEPSSLKVSGNLAVTIQNQGRSQAGAHQLLAFYDTNRNASYDAGSDTLLGTAFEPSVIAAGKSISIDVPVAGTAQYRDEPVSVLADSAQTIVESSEENNISKATCTAAPTQLPPTTVRPTVKWHWTGGLVTSTPLVAPLQDTNGNGHIDSHDRPSVIFLVHHGFVDGDHATLTAVNGVTGETLWTVANSDLQADAPSHPALGDLDGDGIPEIVMYKHGGGMVAVNADGSLKWTSPYPPSPGFYNYGAINIADIDGDGRPEILARNYILNADGTLRFKIPGYFNNNAYSIAIDLNLDGNQELVLQGYAYRADGTRYWPERPVGNPFVSVGNFNEDRYPELVFSGNSHVSLVDHRGNVLWKVSVPGGGGGAPLVADLDGDGWPEIGVAGARYYTVFRRDGSILWHEPVSDGSAQTGSTAFDFNGDGRMEVVYGDQSNLRVYDGQTGHVIYRISNSSATATEEPIVADIDGDGHAEILVVSDGWTTAGIRAIENQDDSWVPTRTIWNEHAYHVSNVNDDGTIPAIEKPSWLNNNTYRVNGFPDRNPLEFPDLSISLLRVVDNGEDHQLSLTARVGNAGDLPLTQKASIVFYDGNPAEGGASLGTISLSSLAQDSYRDVRLDVASPLSGSPIFAVVDPDNDISECDETNNSVSTSTDLESELGNVSITTDRSQYAPADTVTVTVSVENVGSFAGDFSVDLRIEDQSGALVADLGNQALGTLAPGATTEAVVNWPAQAVLAGAYRARAVLNAAGAISLDQAVTVFEILPSTVSGPIASLRTTANRRVYNVTDTATLDNLVQNLSTNALIRGATLKLQVSGPSGDIVFANSKQLGDLPASGSADASFAFSFANAPIGTYKVSASLWDAAGAELATGTADFDVAVQLDQAVSGTTTAQPSMGYVGDGISCTDKVANRTSYSLTGMIRQSIVALAAGDSLDQSEKSVDLAPNEDQILFRNVETDGFAPGDYACALELNVNGQWQPLAHAVFHLSIPPIIIDSAFTQSGHGRLLVLLDPPTLDNNGKLIDDDPNGPPFKPGLSDQRQWLEKLLVEEGWSYTIVTNADDFEHELDTHGYALYALFSEQVKLSEAVQRQLVDEVHRGAGLLVAGGHDRRNGRVEEALGIKSLGHDPHVSGIDIQPFGLFTGGGEGFPLDNKPLDMRTEGASVLGRYRESGNNDASPALTFFTPVEGRGMFIGFDLLQQAVAEHDSSFLHDLLADALAYSHPASLAPYTGAVLPFRITLTNAGLATPGRVTLMLPAGAAVVDPGPGQVDAQGRPVWAFTLDKAQTLTWYLWIKLPPNPGLAAFTASLETGAGSNLKPYGQAQLQVQVVPRP